ncbi:MAG: AsnC family transcriptional regulator [Acidobacteriota bacterium]|nr:AsnC family transcriptional regulator [Acidobacteriota bacterium]
MKDHNSDHLLDDISWKILSELQQNARISFAELGRMAQVRDAGNARIRASVRR